MSYKVARLPAAKPAWASKPMISGDTLIREESQSPLGIGRKLTLVGGSPSWGPS